MVELARWAVLAGILAVPGVALADEEKPEPEAKPAAVKPTEPAEKPRGPAEDLILEAAFGYSVGVFTAIKGHDPKVAHGPGMHFAAGWAWTVKANQSLGVEAAFDGNFDTGNTTGGTRRVAPRYMGYAFVTGEYAHVRVGGGYACSRFEKEEYCGPSVGFAAGWNIPLLPRAKSWKRPYFTADIAPSWDFLKAPGETLNRWTFAVLFGVGIY